MQQNTLYTQEEDDTATLCDYNITNGVLNSDIISENKSKIISPMGIHSKVNISIEMSLVTQTYNIMTSIMVMHSLSKTNIQHYYNMNYKIFIGVYMILSQLIVTKYFQK